VSVSGRGRGPRPAGSRIHAGLVGERELIGTPYLADPGLRAEYEREIAPRTVAALTKVLAEIFPEPADSRPGTVLDLGAGTGAVAGVVRALFGAHQSIVEVDQVARGGATRTADVTHIDALVGFGAPFDLVIAAHVLNELYVGEEATLRGLRLARLVRAWCEELLGDAGTLIIIEPALRETSRALLAVRDQLLAAGLHVVAPCFFTGPCPALVRDRDWCHDSAETAERRVDFSYLVVRATGQAAIDPNCFRVVSDPLPEKGRLRLFGCGVAGRHPLVRLDRHVSARNADLDRLARGDIAHVARTTFAGDGLRVGNDTTVTRVTASSPPAPRPGDEQAPT
jgi:hypothetical protein